MLRTKAPAKLNLRLKIVGRREDGYHELSMVNVALNLFDEISLHLTMSAEPSVEMSPKSSVMLKGLRDFRHNLAYRAAMEFAARFPLVEKPHIVIEKHIPEGAGLGGGSSDAASVLRLMSAAWESDQGELISRDELAAIGARVGADVPYFLSCEPSHVTGIGERLKRFEEPLLEGMEVLLVFPRFGTSTHEVYAAFRMRNPVVPKIEDEFQWDPTSLVANDLEEVVAEANSELKELLSELRQVEGAIASMSGSGSTLFVLSYLMNKIAPEIEARVSSIARAFRATVYKAHLTHLPPISS